MDEFAAKIEALEHLSMRAWMQRDRNQMKAIAARDFIFLLGSEKPTILDRPSWLEAATTRFRCSGYRFGEVYVRRHGNLAIFAASIGLEAKFGEHSWSGESWVTDLWRKTKIRRKWNLVERVLSRPDGDAQMSREIQSMQLWR